MSNVETFAVGETAQIYLDNIVNDAGTLTDPSAIALTITLPDATTVNKAITDFVHDSTGNYHLDYQVPQVGRFTWHAATTNPTTVADGGFRAVPSPESAGLLLDPTDYARVTGDTTSGWADVSLAMLDAQSLVEEYLNRKLGYGSHTETLYVYRDGKCYPTNTPLAAVQTPAGLSSTAIQGAGIYLGVSIPTPAYINAGDWQASVPPQATVIYTGGYQPYGVTGGVTAQLPIKVMRAICRVAYLVLHPVALQTPGTVRSMSVGDVSVSGDLSSFIATDPGITRDLDPYRKRKARGWQRA